MAQSTTTIVIKTKISKKNTAFEVVGEGVNDVKTKRDQYQHSAY
jgi:hypothetical protein